LLARSKTLVINKSSLTPEVAKEDAMSWTNNATRCVNMSPDPFAFTPVFGDEESSGGSTTTVPPFPSFDNVQPELR
jgi:hypothetical protein